MKRGDKRITADRFVIETLELISERGGSHDVNLREVSRRIGCAHTNAYNYFASFEDLMWAAFRRGLRHYGDYLDHDLDDGLAPDEYLRRLVTNLAAYPEVEPGLYRFIGSDPIDLERIPPDILESVARMKQWAFDTFRACVPALGNGTSADAGCNIVLAYIDGETLNLINGRVVPGEDVRGRVVENALHLFACLTPSQAGEHVSPTISVPPYPRPWFEANGAETAPERG